MKTPKYEDGRERLIENYEDAAFALLMDEMASQNGKRWNEENERLKQDPSFEYPEDLDRKCRTLIDKEFAKRKRQEAGRTAVRVLSKVAIVFLVVAVLFAVPFMTVSAFRATVMNFVIDTFDVGSSVYVDTESGGKNVVLPDSIFGAEPQWIPEGFVREEVESYHGIIYVDGEGRKIDFCELGISTRSKVDTEDADVIEKTKVNGFDALLICKGERVMLNWVDTERTVVCNLITDGIDRETTLKIAENVAIK